MTCEKRIELVCIIDRSGSMDSIKSASEEGFNWFLEGHRTLQDKDVHVTLVQFDDQYEMVYDNKPLAEVPVYTLEPRNTTALFDAMGKTINSVGDRLARTAEHERPSKIVVAVVTDGLENASHLFSKSRVFEMIKHQQEKYGWEFAFLAANQDAIASAQDIGIHAKSALNFDATPDGVRCAFNNLTASSLAYASGDASSVCFTPGNNGSNKS